MNKEFYENPRIKLIQIFPNFQIFWNNLWLFRFGDIRAKTRIARELKKCLRNCNLLVLGCKNAVYPISFQISSEPHAQSSWNFQKIFIYFGQENQKRKNFIFLKFYWPRPSCRYCWLKFLFVLYIYKVLHCFCWFACCLFNIRVLIYVDMTFCNLDTPFYALGQHITPWVTGTRPNCKYVYPFSIFFDSILIDCSWNIYLFMFIYNLLYFYNNFPYNNLDSTKLQVQICPLSIFFDHGLLNCSKKLCLFMFT